MNRYLLSFLVTAFIYITTVAALIYFFSRPQYCPHKYEKLHSKQISFCIVAQKTEVKVVEKPKEKPKSKPKQKPKKKPKKKLKKKPKPKPKPIDVPKLVEERIEEKVIEKEIVEEKIIEETLVQEEVTEPPQMQEPTPPVNQSAMLQQEIDSDILLAKQNKFLADLVERINSNKSYPHTARRRCIEGAVEIKFVILADGNVDAIEILSGRKIFIRSAKEAIERSFPMEIDTSIFDFPKEFKIKISYVLKR